MKKEEKVFDLINKSIDGILTSREEAKLKKYLELNPDTQKLYSDMKQVATILDSVKEIEPPVSLKQRIVNTVNAHVPTRPAREGLSLRWILPHVARYRVAYAFTGGAVAGILIFGLLTTGIGRLGTVDVTKLYGSLVDHDYAAKMQPCTSVAVDLNGITGSISTKKGNNIVLTDLEVDSREATDLIVSYDGNSLRILGVGQTEGSGSAMNITDGTVTINAAGKNRYNVYFLEGSQSNSPIRCSLVRAGNVLSEYDLSVTIEQ